MAIEYDRPGKHAKWGLILNMADKRKSIQRPASPEIHTHKEVVKETPPLPPSTLLSSYYLWYYKLMLIFSTCAS